jgi:O-6-methylguanine DNA methyltransferase
MKQKLYDLVRQIPPGTVVTYASLAKKLGIHPRLVGRYLSQNQDPQIPCHRVVMSSYHVGGYNKGMAKKIEILRKEGINIKNEYIHPRD